MHDTEKVAVAVDAVVRVLQSVADLDRHEHGKPEAAP